jgi:hypothetical protein
MVEQLNEASVFLRTGPAGVGFTNKAIELQFSILYDREKATPENSNTPVLFVKPKLFKVKSLRLELYRQNKLDEMREVAQAIALLVLPARDPSEYMDFYTDPRYFTFAKFNSVAEFFNFCQTKNIMGEQTFKSAFGFVPQNTQDAGGAQHVKLGDIDLWFTETARASTQQNVIQIVTLAKKYLEKRYLGKLLSGTIQVVALKANTTAMYDLNSHNIQLNSSYLAKDGASLFAIIHELAHHFHHDNDRKQEIDHDIRAKYLDLKRTDKFEYAKIDDAPLFDVIHDLINVDGAQIVYNGKSSKHFKRGEPVEVQMNTLVQLKRDKGIEYQNVKLMANNSNASFTVNLAYLFSSNRFIFKIPEKHDQTFDISAMDRQHWEEDYSSEQWFFTKYAEKNHEEFFAELFAAHLLGKTKGKPDEWMSYIIKEYGGRFFG